MEPWVPHLDEVELIDAELRADGLRDVEDIVAVGGDDVAVHEVCRDRRLCCHHRRLCVTAAALEDDGLDRDIQPPPLPCTRASGAQCMHSMHCPTWIFSETRNSIRYVDGRRAVRRSKG